MSWRNRGRGSSDAPPRAFAGYNDSRIHGAIIHLANEQRHMAIRHLSSDDLLQLFIPAEHRHAVKQAFGYARPNMFDQSLNINLRGTETYVMADPSSSVQLSLAWDYSKCPEGFFTPHNGKVSLQPDAPLETVEKLEFFQQEMLRISWEFGLVKWVFQNLNVNGYCNTPQQMRFVWPAIRHLVDKAGLKDLGKQLVDASARAGDRARVPLAIADYMVPTVNIVARTLVMGEIDTDDKRDFKVRIEVPTFVLPNGASFSGVV